MSTTPEVAYCLQRVGADAPSGRTLLVRGTGTTSRPLDVVWQAFSDVGSWPAWSVLHKAAGWTSSEGFVSGATFDQRLVLGFPVGTVDAHVVVDVVIPHERVSWVSDDGGFRSCHLWQFSPLPEGGTAISNVEVFSGRLVPLLRPLVAKRWNRLFQQTVDGLIATVT